MQSAPLGGTMFVRKREQDRKGKLGEPGVKIKFL